MRLEKQEQEKLARRKGLTGRTIIQVIWLLLSFGIAYFLVTVLVDQGVFTIAQLRQTLTVPRTIPDWAIQGAVMFVIVIAMQIIFFMAYAFASPEGRRRTGTPSMHSRNKDPFSDDYQAH